MKKNKSTAAMLALSMATAFVPVMQGASAAVFTDVSTGSKYYEAVNRLSELGIINGYEDGSFRPDNNVTRAEFSKIIVGMMNKSTEAKSTPPSSAFDDVNQVQWCIPYVNYLTANGVIKGYADATFRPSNIITYAEAATIICRVLGYDEATVGYSWPANYMNEAAALELSDTAHSASDPVTRAVVAEITDNALFTYVNGKSEVKYLESIGYSVLEDCYIVANRDNDSSLRKDEIRVDSSSSSQSSGMQQQQSDQSGSAAQQGGGSNKSVYKVKNDYIIGMVGSTGTLIVNDDNEAVSFDSKYMYTFSVTVKDVEDNRVITYKTSDNQVGSYQFAPSFTVYYNNNKTTYDAIKNEVVEGTKITFSGEDANEWIVAVVDIPKNNVVPVRASKNYTLADNYLEGTPINYKGLTVYRDNKTVTVADIKADDVIYYNTNTNTMDVYTKKVTGIYNKALPSKAYVTSVNVGGNEYKINSKVSTAKLDASDGSFNIGDKVTLLLGKNDEVCFAVESSGFDTFSYGVVLKTYFDVADSGDKEGSSRYMASVFMADGNTYEYETDKNYKDYIGDLVQIEYGNDAVTMKMASNSNVYGELNKGERTLGGKKLLKDVVIFNRLSKEYSSTPEIELISYDTFDAVSIPSNQLITSVSANAFGDIAVLYINSASSGYKYGYAYKTRDKTTGAIGMTIYTATGKEEYSNVSFSISGNAFYYKVSQTGQISELKPLSTLVNGRTVQAVESGRIMVDNKIYTLSDDVLIINVSGAGEYKVISVNELASYSRASVTLYSETSDSNGVVRIIKVT